ncbi:MAG: prolipoprotein diacylglyceryl transferase [Caldicoprobacterales bacterium]|jgi:phosphatidylglycerol:prolipoprotein diacylglycerol transferase|nr:prolipoprotein diacylglyceryl transferase [Clostridiales bacterium]
MNPNPIAFQLFGQPIYWYGILISIGVLLGILLAMRNARVFGIEQDSLIDFALLAIPLAIIGARLYYVVFKWDLYRENLLDIINIRKGGLAIYGGVIGGILAGVIFTKWKKLDFWNLADICAPSLILGQAIGRWGNYINQEAFGPLVKNPEWQWFPAAVFIDAEQQWHLATFFYESAWNFIVFFILMIYRKRRKKAGEVFLLYLILYALGRFFIEGLRTDSLFLGAGNIRVSQWLSAILFAAGVGLFVYRRMQSKRSPSNLEEAVLNEDGIVTSDESTLSFAAEQGDPSEPGKDIHLEEQEATVQQPSENQTTVSQYDTDLSSEFDNEG